MREVCVQGCVPSTETGRSPRSVSFLYEAADMLERSAWIHAACPSASRQSHICTELSCTDQPANGHVFHLGDVAPCRRCCPQRRMATLTAANITEPPGCCILHTTILFQHNPGSLVYHSFQQMLLSVSSGAQPGGNFCWKAASMSLQKSIKRLSFVDKLYPNSS